MDVVISHGSKLQAFEVIRINTMGARLSTIVPGKILLGQLYRGVTQ